MSHPTITIELIQRPPSKIRRRNHGTNYLSLGTVLVVEPRYIMKRVNWFFDCDTLLVNSNSFRSSYLAHINIHPIPQEATYFLDSKPRLVHHLDLCHEELV